VTPDILKALQAARLERRAAALVTWLDDGKQLLARPDETAEPRELAEALEEAFADDRSGTVEIGGRQAFVHVFNPPLRLIVIGAVHIAEPLARFAAIAGYDVTLIDPRRAFADRDRFPGVTVMDAWPDEALGQLAPDRRTAIVTLTHDPKIDDPALHVALKSGAFYVGSLGSKRTHAERVERLKEADFSDGEIARIHAPVGLDIGAKSPQEIALSIMSEIVAVRQGKAP
jgi:xanthine dehydrogenase accessory factor